MTEASRKVWHCDGVLDDFTMCKDWTWGEPKHGEAPWGWLMLQLYGGPRHLCPKCATSGNVQSLMDKAAVSKIIRERGD